MLENFKNTIPFDEKEINEEEVIQRLSKDLNLAQDEIKDMSSYNKEKLFRRNTIVDIKYLSDQEKYILVSLLFKVNKGLKNNKEIRENYIGAVKDYLGQVDYNDSISYNEIDTINDLDAQKGILQCLMELLLIDGGDYGFVAREEELLAYFSINIVGLIHIRTNLDNIFVARGLEGFVEKYSYPSEDSQSLDLSSNKFRNQLGNSIYNLKQGGYFAKQDNIIYFRDAEDQDFLYKMDDNMDFREKLSEDRPFSINVVGDHIYYFTDQGEMVKLGLDGSDRQVIFDLAKNLKMKSYENMILFVIEDRIYFTDKPFDIVIDEKDNKEKFTSPAYETGLLSIDINGNNFIDLGREIYHLAGESNSQMKLIDFNRKELFFIVFDEENRRESYLYIYNIGENSFRKASGRISTYDLPEFLMIDKYIYSLSGELKQVLFTDMNYAYIGIHNLETGDNESHFQKDSPHGSPFYFVNKYRDYIISAIAGDVFLHKIEDLDILARNSHIRPANIGRTIFSGARNIQKVGSFHVVGERLMFQVKYNEEGKTYRKIRSLDFEYYL